MSSSFVLKEPLHVFSIPQSIARSLIPRAAPGQTPPALLEPQDDESPEAIPSGSLSCALCAGPGVTFENVNDQRNHFRSDWHRYNVKAKVQDANARPVTEAEFLNLMEGLNESLSGSASSSSEDDSHASDADAVSTLISRQKRKLKGAAQSVSSEEGQLVKVPRTPVVWLQSPLLPDTQLGVYTTIFPNGTTQNGYPAALADLQDGGEKGRTWALFMTAGGHFAGMIVRVSKPGVVPEPKGEAATAKKGKKGGGGKPQPEFQVLAHKTFHRYTTRRKQGGSQSVNDNAKGNAKSAGAQLRRYGEQALRDDIRGLLSDWVEELDACDRIFIRASVSNRRIFLEGEDGIIQKGDERLRTFPFPTRRPTLAELTRCLTQLTRVKVSHLTEEALKTIDEAYLASLPKPKPKPTASTSTPVSTTMPKKPTLSPEEEILRDKWRRLLEMVQKGRLEVLKNFWAKESETLRLASVDPNMSTNTTPVDMPIPDWLRDEEKCGITLLQAASAASQEEVVQWLLEDLHADPTIPVPSSLPPSASSAIDADGSDAEAGASASSSTARTAYSLASTRGVRNVFRRAAWAHPDWWDWLGKGRLPSALNPEKEEEQSKKKGLRRKGLKERAKEREDEQAALRIQKEKEEAEARELERIRRDALERQKASSRTGPQKLGGGQTSGGLTGNAGLAGMTPEMRARIERERRARAAEARLGGK